MNRVIFLQSKLPDDMQALQQIANRWISYGEVLQKQGSREALWVVTPYPLNELSRNILVSKFISNFQSVEQYNSVFGRFNALQKIIRSEKIVTTLVCGDNQLSLILALALKIWLKPLVRIQIQFHGDTYSFKFNKGARGFLRVCLSRLGIAFADSIRIVSQFQADEIRLISKSAGERFVLAPIPIDFSKVATKSSDVRYELTFVGRLHPERGISDLIKIIESLKDKRPSTTVVIVGEGSLKNEIKQKFENWIQDSTITMLGFLSSDEIREIYASSKVLVSTAPTEGYGLTLREAALSNVHVVARESKGSLGAKASFPSRIETFANIDEAVLLIQTHLDIQSFRDSSSDISSQTKADAQGLDRLIKSWIKN
jgi:glycosyltransferase involved in cell wall biosynthesis